MANMTKNVIIGSMGIAGIVALLSIVDLIVGFPFQGQMLMDLMFIAGAAMVGYMGWEDRKSTRLNSSHVVISYAVFCLKKKKTNTQRPKTHPTV